MRNSFVLALACVTLVAGPVTAQRKSRRVTATLPPGKTALPDNLQGQPKGTTPFVQKEENGQVNWTQQYIEADGESVLDNDKFKNPAQARAMAIRGATVLAQRNLLEIVKGVNVTSETTVEDMITTKDIVITQIQGVVKGAQMVGQPIVADGSVKVKLRMPLYAQNGLAPIVYQADSTTPPPGPQAQLPTEATAPATMETAGTDGTGKVPDKGIAFNMNGKTFDPALFPVVVDEQGNVLLNTKSLYDPKSGKFPQILNASKDVLNAIGYKKGVEILDVLSAEDGKIKISDASKSKINWSAIWQTGLKLLKFFLL